MSYYDREMHLNWDTTWERQNNDGTYSQCNRRDVGAREVRTCQYCGRRILGYRCTCEESKW